MTNEEAVKCLKLIEVLKFKDMSESYLLLNVEQALDLAIKALEQTSEDCISRADALKVIEDEKKGWEGSERYAIDECHGRIMRLPSVTPKQRED